MINNISQNKSENASIRLLWTSSAKAVDAKFSSTQQAQTGFGYFVFDGLTAQEKKI